MRGCVCVLALCLLLGCDEKRTVEIRVCSDAVVPPVGSEYIARVDGEVIELESDAAVPDDADTELETQIDTVRILGRDMNFEELNGGGRELDSGNAAPAQGFDLAIDFPTRSGTRFIEVEALLRGVKVGSFTRSVDKLDSLETLEMPLTEDCYGMICGVGQTCVRGACRLAPGRTGGASCAGAGL